MAEWISVEDRLPEEHKECTVYIGTVTFGCFDGHGFLSTDDFLTGYENGDDAEISYIQPTHWQPLPDPPKE